MNKLKLLSNLSFIFFITSCGDNNQPTAPQNNQPNVPPTVLLNQNYEVARTGILTIVPHIEDDHQVSSVNWEQLDGASIEVLSTEEGKIEFKAPYIDEEESSTWRITVIDSDGAKTSKDITIYIKPNLFSDDVISTKIDYIPDDSSYIGFGRFLVAKLMAESNPQIILTRSENGVQSIDVLSFENSEISLSTSLDIGTYKRIAVANILKNGRSQLLLSNDFSGTENTMKFLDDVLEESSEQLIQLSNTADYFDGARDFDGDGTDELVFATNQDKDVIACDVISSSDSEFACTGKKIADVERKIYGHSLDLSYRKFVDLNGDGKADLIERKLDNDEQQSGSVENTSIKVSFQTGLLTFSEVARIPEKPSDNSFRGLVDINQDGLVDLLFGSNETCNLIENDGSTHNNFVTQRPISVTPCELGETSLIDSDGDGVKEVLTSSGTFYEAVIRAESYELNRKPALFDGVLADLVDIDGDNDLDFIWYVTDDTVWSFDVFAVINENSGFSENLRFYIYRGDEHDYSFAGIDRKFHDMDSDGDLDLIILQPDGNTGEYSITVRKNLLVSQ